MAAAQYIGVGGVARKVKAQFVGVGGVARKVKNGYIGVGGVARKFYTGLDIKPTLADNDWATIAAVSEAGQASAYWSVGDEKDITVNGETLTMVIVGFDHDDLASGGKAGITFGMKHLMKDTRKMSSPNNGATNYGGFTGSGMYTWLQDTLLPTIPSDLQSVIKSVNKKTSAGDKSATINTNAMKLFLFSEVEVFGSISHSFTGEGSQYSYFSTTDSRIKKLQNGAGNAWYWFERSPYKSSNASFCSVTMGGIADVSYSSAANGVCFAFCV